MFGVITPRIVSYLFDLKYIGESVFTVQYVTLIIELASSIYLLIVNIKDIQITRGRDLFIRILFLLLSLLLTVFFAFVIYIQFRLRDGIGF